MTWLRPMVAWLLALPLCSAGDAPTITLATRCPPSFESDGEGACRLRTLYQGYSAVGNHGGVQMALPKARDGFTPSQIDLGRYLFFDPLLSRDRRTSCAHCHHPDHGLSDGLRTAVGVGAQGAGAARRGGVPLKRRTPTLWNVAFADTLFWDGRAATLEAQAREPLFSPLEMGNTPERLQADLNANPVYRRLFEDAFGTTDAGQIQVRHIAVALAAFQTSLVSLNSRYDRYAHGDQEALTPRELQGMNVFRGFVARCTQCHTPPLFTNLQLATIGVGPSRGQPVDLGAGGLAGDPSLRGAFKVPTLRNVSRTGPFHFHGGQAQSLEQAVEFYNAPRGHDLPKGEKQPLHWHVHMLKPQLSRDDVAAVVSFLGALEDETARPLVPEAVPSGLPVLSSVRALSSVGDH